MAAGVRPPGYDVENVWFLAVTWVGLALIATLFAIWFRISTALSEIVVGTVAQLIIGAAVGTNALGSSRTQWDLRAGDGQHGAEHRSSVAVSGPAGQVVAVATLNMAGRKEI